MAESVLLGLNGEPNIYECAFVASEVRSLQRHFAPSYAAPREGVSWAPLQSSQRKLLMLTGAMLTMAPMCSCEQVIPDVPYFATKCLLGPAGVAKVLATGELDSFEKAGFEGMLVQLKGEIKKGVDFVKNPPAPAAAS